jgi:hypothetical protein
MRLTALVLATGLLWPGSTFAQDEGASHPGFLTGNKLYEECPLLRLCDGSFRRAERDETELFLRTPQRQS